MHKHNHKLIKIDREPKEHGKYGFVYLGCECGGSIRGVPISTPEELKDWENQIKDLMGEF